MRAARAAGLSHGQGTSIALHYPLEERNISTKQRKRAYFYLKGCTSDVLIKRHILRKWKRNEKKEILMLKDKIIQKQKYNYFVKK